jgi:hypothetical protein
MNKAIKLFLNKFATIPNSLRPAPKIDVPVAEVDVDSARLYHHYYLDTRGYAPPNPDPARFEHLELLLPCSDFRVRGDGFGVGVAFRQHRSNELGQALCRWFLYEHLNITYFAHMQSVLDQSLHPGFGKMRIERVLRGDAPDYFCAESTSKVFLAEAKGRTTSINFSNSEFEKWRKQFDRVIVKDGSGLPKSVKGYIVATRFVTERNPSLRSTLFAEDPKSPGGEELGNAPNIGSVILALHYAEIAAKIRQPLLSASLASGVPVPDEIQFPAAVWECQLPILHGMRFVGGYFPGANGVIPLKFEDNKIALISENPFRLDVADGTFFGVEEKIFKALCAVARRGSEFAHQVPRLADIPFIYSGFSVLRDGSAIGPIQFFRPVGVEVY